ncbi:TonB-dependent receptor [Chitinimonas sp.]|uniref:TonB-dependent receptor n=1 Tax=Chitinimonas sp. TaxID=1934313 RepID=UPI0035AED66A
MRISQLAYAISLIGAIGAFAEDAPTVQKVEKIEVTGSNIKRVSKEGVSPVTTISREDISRSGATSVMDLMRKLTSAGGNGNETLNNNSFRNGATEVNLRSLPTLVLLNGYRLPSSGSDEYSGETSVDLNTIPLAAIDRVEVLKDGASAIYGTDAVGGVVNFILRKDAVGTEIDGYFGKTTHGDGDVARASLAGGLGDRSTQGFNLTYALSYEERKAIKATDRDWSNLLDFRGKPGGLFQGSVYGAKGTDPGTLSLGGRQRQPDPACPANRILPYPNVPEIGAGPDRIGCYYAPAEGENLLHPYSRYSGVAVANWEINSSTTLFAQVFLNHYDTKLSGRPTAVYNADNNGPIAIEANNPINPYGKRVVVRRLFQSDDSGTKSDIDSRWLVAGAKGQLGSWDWTISAGHSQEDGVITTYGSYLLDKLNAYAATGKYNPFGGNNNSPQIIRELTADQHVDTQSQTEFFGAKASTELGELPGGPIGIAIGTEFKRDKLTYNPSQAWRDGNIGLYTTLLGINGSQHQSAVFTEFNLPILKNLEAQAAIRYDKYQLAGSTTNPKLGLRWTPFKNLLLRTSYSTGFRAPTLSQEFNEGRGGFASARDPKRCVVGDEYFDNDCTSSVLSLVTGSKNLKPEKTSNFNFGFVFEPIKDMSVGATYWRIKWKDRIESLDSDSVLSNEDGSAKGSVIRFPVSDDDRAAYAALTPAQRAAMGPLVGALKQVNIGLINRAEVFTDGYDVDASYAFRVQDLGKIKVFGEASYTSRYNKSKQPGDSTINCANNFSCEAGEYQYPRVLGKLGFNWDMGPWGTQVVANYTSNYRVDRTTSETINVYYDEHANGLNIPSSTLVDMSVSYTGFKNMTLRFGAENLFDRDPPFSPSKSLGYDTAYGNPRGRFVYGSVNYKFN